jgi:arylsulfatase A-like enzyme
VPGVVEWPARIPRPFVSEMPCSTLDIYPTILAATGAVAPNQIQPLDGLSLLPLFDRQMETRAKAIPFWNRAGQQPGHAAWLEWPYKLHTDAREGRDKRGRKGLAVHTAPLLYDVAKDPKETTDLAAQQPERVAKMTAALEAWKASVEKSLTGADHGKAPIEPRTPPPAEPRNKKKKSTAP